MDEGMRISKALKIVKHYQRIAMDLHLSGTQDFLIEVECGLDNQAWSIDRAIDALVEYWGYVDALLGKGDEPSEIHRGLFSELYEDLSALADNSPVAAVEDRGEAIK